MALETSQYREEAIALLDKNYSVRAVAKILEQRYDRPVASYSTIWFWSKGAGYRRRYNQQQEAA